MGRLCRSWELGILLDCFTFFQNDPAYATLQVEEDGTKVWCITTSGFSELLHSNPDMNDAFIKYLNYRIRNQFNVLSEVKKALGEEEGISVAFFDSKSYMRSPFEELNDNYGFNFKWFVEKLSPQTAILAQDCQVVCCFVNDNIGRETVESLAPLGISLIAMRCAGYDNVDLQACEENNITVTRVPAYSPYAVAEFAVSLMLEINRKMFIAVERVKSYNFSLNGLTGFDMHGKTVGVIGTGKIGQCVINILIGFGCNVVCYDVYKAKVVEDNPNATYVELDELYAVSDIITAHVPLLDSTKHMLNAESFAKMKDGVIIINTSRGGLVNTPDLIDALRQKKVGGAGLDVYEGEKKYFFEDASDMYIDDPVLTQLLAQKNVVVTSHQAFLTKEALGNIAESTMNSINDFKQGKRGDDISNRIKN
eukprot:TRINITY_DN4750_c0_g1_i2.p1 TRINITY_DN4750_c0_g1~~TRINITY_DN4750_c0_g1_i2.p1  ORF type:complete len:422 (-),score=88.35 TRINITY_DN4750_c0_g1_i2:25-1290(-)